MGMDTHLVDHFFKHAVGWVGFGWVSCVGTAVAHRRKQCTVGSNRWVRHMSTLFSRQNGIANVLPHFASGLGGAVMVFREWQAEFAGGGRDE